MCRVCVCVCVLQTQTIILNILSKQLLQSFHHRLCPPPPPHSICPSVIQNYLLLTLTQTLTHKHTSAMAQGTQCTVTHIPRKRRYDITLSSPVGPWEDRRGERLRARERKREREWYGKTVQQRRRSGVNQSGARGCKGPWLGCVWSVSFKGGTAGRAITDDLPLAAGPGATLTESNHKQVNSTSTFLIFFPLSLSFGLVLST